MNSTKKAQKKDMKKRVSLSIMFIAIGLMFIILAGTVGPLIDFDYGSDNGYNNGYNNGSNNGYNNGYNNGNNNGNNNNSYYSSGTIYAGSSKTVSLSSDWTYYSFSPNSSRTYYIETDTTIQVKVITSSGSEAKASFYAYDDNDSYSLGYLSSSNTYLIGVKRSSSSYSSSATIKIDY